MSNSQLQNQEKKHVDPYSSTSRSSPGRSKSNSHLQDAIWLGSFMFDVQFLRGYSLLLPDPVVVDLNALDKSRRAEYLLDMTILGDALLEVTGAYRINYEILGNLDPALHAHVVPRYITEPEEMRKGPPYLYYKDYRNSVKFDYKRDQELMKQIAESVLRRLYPHSEQKSLL